MNNLKFLGMSAIMALMVSCGGGDSKTDATTSDNSASSSSTTTTTSTSTSAAPAPAASGDSSSYDPTRGNGKWNESNVDVSKFDPAMAEAGKKVAEVKCFSCHKTTDEKLVGPGWKGITLKQKPYWIMNFITNPDPMIDKDPEIKKQFEICLVRMPNQGLNDTEARQILEFMRQNDGAK